MQANWYVIPSSDGYVIVASAIYVIYAHIEWHMLFHSNYIRNFVAITYRNELRIFSYSWFIFLIYAIIIIWKKNLLLEDSQKLSNNILKLCNSLSKNKDVSNIIFQLRKSGTSVHANIREGNYPQSLADMLSKFQIARKECYETEGWLQTLYNNEYISLEYFKQLRNLAGKIRKLLTSSCITIERKIK